MTIKIPLSIRGRYAGKYTAIVSDEDADLAQLRWSACKRKNSIYAYRGTYTIRKGSTQRLHHAVMERILERPLRPKELVDHINGNGLDNRRENLRVATNTQNNANARKSITNKSGYKGVYKANRVKENKWSAKISVKNKSIYLGLYDSPEEAHKAYCEAAKKYFGEFANFG